MKFLTKKRKIIRNRNFDDYHAIRVIDSNSDKDKGPPSFSTLIRESVKNQGEKGSRKKLTETVNQKVDNFQFAFRSTPGTDGCSQDQTLVNEPVMTLRQLNKCCKKTNDEEKRVEIDTDISVGDAGLRKSKKVETKKIGKIENTLGVKKSVQENPCKNKKCQHSCATKLSCIKETEVKRRRVIQNTVEETGPSIILLHRMIRKSKFVNNLF
ncbi:unnamed protein product [Psylliodes chrysocephalus]|uniref:Uncharacterized protein n=1 Tax=Psylliodes chrysocephalus TaxID=3402493 RepID=A0A9P0GI07_9CUCU|nr:unnamed protein product [Psylliodes chrysocephala]